jgi:hypothetical protein
VSIVLSRGKDRLREENNGSCLFHYIFGGRETKKGNLPACMEGDKGQEMKRFNFSFVTEIFRMIGIQSILILYKYTF